MHPPRGHPPRRGNQQGDLVSCKMSRGWGRGERKNVFNQTTKRTTPSVSICVHCLADADPEKVQSPPPEVKEAAKGVAQELVEALGEFGVEVSLGGAPKLKGSSGPVDKFQCLDFCLTELTPEKILQDMRKEPTPTITPTPPPKAGTSRQTPSKAPAGGEWG